MVVPRKLGRVNTMGEYFAAQADWKMRKRSPASGAKPYTIPPNIIEEFNRHQSIVDAAKKAGLHPDELLAQGMHVPGIMENAATQWLGSQQKIVREEWERVPSANFLALRIGIKLGDLLGKRRRLIPKNIRPAFYDAAKRELLMGHPAGLSGEERAKLLEEVEKNKPRWMQEGQ